MQHQGGSNWLHSGCSEEDERPACKMLKVAKLSTTTSSLMIVIPSATKISRPAVLSQGVGQLLVCISV
jgi:hypothetical protein